MDADYTRQILKITEMRLASEIRMYAACPPGLEEEMNLRERVVNCHLMSRNITNLSIL
jgi:hypothetical protein